MTYKLGIVPARPGGFAIAWIDEDGENGLTLGEYGRGDVEHAAATKAARACSGAEMVGGRLRWSSERDARVALQAAKSAAKAALDGKKWPAWAVMARAAGWKPPKGWKP